VKGTTALKCSHKLQRDKVCIERELGKLPANTRKFARGAGKWKRNTAGEGKSMIRRALLWVKKDGKRERRAAEGALLDRLKWKSSFLYPSNKEGWRNEDVGSTVTKRRRQGKGGDVERGRDCEGKRGNCTDNQKVQG